MGVTIVSNELSEDEIKEIQSITDSLQNEKDYSLYAIMHYLGMEKKLSISLYLDEGKCMMNCRKIIF